MAGRRFIVAGRFIDGSGAEVRRDVFLEVKDGVIAAIGSVSSLPHQEGVAVEDFSHCIILPALVDCSVSLARSPSVDLMVQLSFEASGAAQKFDLVEQHICDSHAHGVLGVADGDCSGLLQRYQEARAQEGIIKIRTPSFRSQCPNSATGVADGNDFIRIAYSGNIEDKDVPGSLLKNEELGRMLQHKEGKKAVVVANGPQQVEEALKAGCDAIEQGYAMGEANLRKMAQMGVLWIPSALRAKNALDGVSADGEVCCRFSQRYVAPGKPEPGAQAFWKKTLAQQLTQLRVARELGVTTAIGTGAGSAGILHGESMVEEMKLFIKAGYSLEEAIRSASENGAAFFGMDTLGTLAVGHNATFLIARGSVKQLPRKLAYLEGIYVNGVPSAMYQKNPVKIV